MNYTWPPARLRFGTCWRPRFLASFLRCHQFGSRRRRRCHCFMLSIWSRPRCWRAAGGLRHSFAKEFITKRPLRWTDVAHQIKWKGMAQMLEKLSRSWNYNTMWRFSQLFFFESAACRPCLCFAAVFTKPAGFADFLVFRCNVFMFFHGNQQNYFSLRRFAPRCVHAWWGGWSFVMSIIRLGIIGVVKI